MGDCAFNWLGSIFSVVAGFLLKTFYDIIRNNYEKFKGECRIKGELEGISHDFDVAGRPNEMIEFDYGAEFIKRHPHMLFGEHNSEALRWYTRFNTFNSERGGRSFDENETRRESIKNMLEADLGTDWLKRIPSEPSILGYLKYLRKRGYNSWVS